MWQILSAAGVLAAAAGIYLVNEQKKRRRDLEKAKAKKLAELSASGFTFSKEYNMGDVVLMVDRANRQWVLLDFSAPKLAQPRPFSAIQDVRIISRQKVHNGVKSAGGNSMLRGSLNQSKNRVENVTDTMRGVEITIQDGTEKEVLYIDCLDADYSAERVEAILNSLQEQAQNSHTPS